MKMVKVTGLVLLTSLAAYVVVWWFLTGLNAYFE